MKSPYGLVENAGRWYLLAGRDGDQRTYRVSRIVSAEVLDEAARIPEGFDLAAAWQAQRDAFEQFSETCTITVALDPAIVDVFSTHARFQLAAGTGIVAEGEHEGRAVLTLTFRAWRAAVAIVLAYGEQAKLLAPTYLRARVLDLARGSVAAHEPDGS